MNRTLLTRLNRLLKDVSAELRPVFLRRFLQEIFTLPPTERAPDGYAVFQQKAAVLFAPYPPKDEGTGGALTPEIFALLHESNTAHRKHRGVFYTPWALADLLARETLFAVLTRQAGTDNATAQKLLNDNHFTLNDKTLNDFLSRLTVCDPAAGAGGLLLPFALHLARVRKKLNPSLETDTLLADIFDKNIYGTDLDKEALAVCRQRAYLLLRGLNRKTPFCPVITHLYTADALETRNGALALRALCPNGFDVILANPPFVGQKNHAALFRRLKQNPFWAAKITPKSDLLYLFFYLALGLLRERGCGGFITTPYFTTSDGARALRAVLKQNAAFLRLIDFGGTHLFPQAGQHTLLSVFQKNAPDVPCKVGAKAAEISQAQLYTGPNNYLQICPPANDLARKLLEHMRACPRTLADVAVLSNGLMSGCDKISPAHLKKFPHLRAKKGEGVFVLSADEVNALNLLPCERQKLKPFFKNSDISAFIANHTPNHYLIDIFYPKDRAIDWEKYPNLYAHLSRFKPVLLARKQNNNGIDKALTRGEFWFGSVRRRMNFDGEKLLIPHRAERNKFAYCDVPWYASSDVYFITSPKNGVTLWYLLALFNSKPYEIWLKHYGKRKGDLLELYTAPLRQLPVPVVPAQRQAALEQLARQIYRLKTQGLPTAPLEETLHTQVCALFGLNQAQTGQINPF